MWGANLFGPLGYLGSLGAETGRRARTAAIVFPDSGRTQRPEPDKWWVRPGRFEGGKDSTGRRWMWGQDAMGRPYKIYLPQYKCKCGRMFSEEHQLDRHKDLDYAGEDE